MRAYDSSDIEQWLEQSPSAQTWFADEIGRINSGVRSLEKCWHDWSNVGDVALDPSLFDGTKEDFKGKIEDFFKKGVGTTLNIFSDSREEALAFLSQVVAEEKFSTHRERVIVVDGIGVIPRLAQGNAELIVVVHSREVLKELEPNRKNFKILNIHPRNSPLVEPYVELNPLDPSVFRAAFKKMGKTRDETKDLEKASGRSLTVLRRQLAKFSALRVPEWASELDNAELLVPFALAGAWDTRNEEDRNLLSRLAAVEYGEVERKISILLELDDPPIWSAGGIIGVASNFDALTLIGNALSTESLKRFYECAEIVFKQVINSPKAGEHNYLLMAVKGELREYSNSLRNGLLEALILLSVHGKKIIPEQLNVDGEREAVKLLRKVLGPIQSSHLKAFGDDLRFFAESAPETFLELIEQDLRTEDPEVMDLMGIYATQFGSCPRAGLLFALESLAWNSESFPRVVRILAQLSEAEINDNWMNKPSNSLAAIFRAWMPQTGVGVDERIEGIRMLAQKYPKIGWEICLQQLQYQGLEEGRQSYKPRWRRDGFNCGEPLETYEPIFKFKKEIIEILLSKESYTVDMLVELVPRLPYFLPKDQGRVWTILENWASTDVEDVELVRLREKIRVTLLTKSATASLERQRVRGIKGLSKKAKLIYAAMRPKDVVENFEWLFRGGLVVEDHTNSFTQIEDFEKLRKRTRKLRAEALKEVMAERGLSGIIALAEKGRSQREIGDILFFDLFDDAQIKKFILQCLRQDMSKVTRAELISGALPIARDERAKFILESLQGDLSESEAVDVLIFMPYGSLTWHYVDQLPQKEQQRFWSEVTPTYVSDLPQDNVRSVEELLQVGRPCAAFSTVYFAGDKITSSLFVKMLFEMAERREGDVENGVSSEYKIQDALNFVHKCAEIPLEIKAQLEFIYISFLAMASNRKDGTCVPNLERFVGAHPEFFVWLIKLAFKRDDLIDDPPEAPRDAPKSQQSVERVYRALEEIRLIPGQEEATPDKQFERLSEWVELVRKLSLENGRSEIADLYIGKLLSRSPIGSDGVWPNEATRGVIESVNTDELMEGVVTGKLNSRGGHWCMGDGREEWEFAKQFKDWSDILRYSSPVTSKVLEGIVKEYEFLAQHNDQAARIRRRGGRFDR